MMPRFYANFGKRILDFTLAWSLLVAFLPIIGVVGLLVWIRLGSPVLFRQLRPGLNGKPFTMFKFRTMADSKDAKENLLPNHMRLNNFGKILRSSSLDELPELFNVIRGDMSIVGPRPLLMDYLPLYSTEQRKRHDVRGGITGLAQIKGRNILDFEDRFRYDVYYVENFSFFLDLKIMCETIARVVRRENVIVDERILRKKFENAGMGVTNNGFNK